jgi:hypothetical protein
MIKSDSDFSFAASNALLKESMGGTGNQPKLFSDHEADQVSISD